MACTCPAKREACCTPLCAARESPLNLDIHKSNLVRDGASLHSLPQGPVGCQPRTGPLVPFAHGHLQQRSTGSAHILLDWGSLKLNSNCWGITYRHVL